MNDNETSMSNDEGRISYGLLLCWVLNTAEIFSGFFLLSAAFLGVALIGGIGIIQLIYVLPFYFSFKKQGKSETAKGIVIAASITALLNATCWGVAMGH